MWMNSSLQSLLVMLLLKVTSSDNGLGEVLQRRGRALAFNRGLTLIIPAWPVIDLLTVGESRQMIAVVEKIRTALLTTGDIYLLSTFRLPPKQGGVLFGLYSRHDNTRWLEASVVGKINKGD